MVEVNCMSPSLKWESGILIRVVVPAGLCVPGKVTFIHVPGTVLEAGAKVLHMTGQVAILMDLD